MRGKALRGFQVHVDAGITPAYAGKSSCNFRFSFCHPGSPPHVRGKGLHILAHGLDVGITPACAGKRCLHRFCKGISKDHPRVCGEKSRCWLDLEPPTGSPPRMRGKGLGASKGCDGVGITPACAGKSASHGCGSRGWRDHPRVCGEKWKVWPGLLPLSGSPPRMRGKAATGRLIVTVTVDHPRVCGEKLSSRAGRPLTRGSPPRMRGKD